MTDQREKDEADKRAARRWHLEHYGFDPQIQRQESMHETDWLLMKAKVLSFIAGRESARAEERDRLGKFADDLRERGRAQEIDGYAPDIDLFELADEVDATIIELRAAKLHEPKP